MARRTGKPSPAYANPAIPIIEIVSAPDNTYLFGATGDQHLGSKYERLDILNALFDRYAQAGVSAVFNTGNWIDGTLPLNVHDIHSHGAEAQCEYLAAHWPYRPGVTTYAVTGDDHEGWEFRNGIDIGNYAELKFREARRNDWVDIGYVEAHVRLVNANTGAVAIMNVQHTGGGSSYAVSHRVQKIIDSLDSEERPDVMLVGHLHKLAATLHRGVWSIQTGTCQMQTPWQRKKSIEAHLGGAMVHLEQDPESGRIIGCTPTMWRYFVQTNEVSGRWSRKNKRPPSLPEINNLP